MGNGPARRDDPDRHTVVRDVIERRRELDSSTDWDALAGALSKRRRRYLLYLVAEDSPVSVDAVASRVLALEEEVLGPRAVEETQEDVLISLVHRDVPVLAETGLVAYDEEDGVVARGDRFSDAIELLDRAFGHSSEQEA